MWATETIDSNNNGLDAVAAGAGALLAMFLLLGGAGHLAATWTIGDQHSVMRLLPGLLLLAAATFNGLAFPGLLRGRRSWQWTALAVNSALALYLGRLLGEGVPNHPIGIFLALVCSHLVMLTAVVAGLEWRRDRA